MVTLSPVKLPSPVREPKRCLEECRKMLQAKDTKDEEHPDIKEMRRRVLSNVEEMTCLDFFN